MPNRKFILLNRPKGLPKESDFKLIEEEINITPLPFQSNKKNN